MGCFAIVVEWFYLRLGGFLAGCCICLAVCGLGFGGGWVCDCGGSLFACAVGICVWFGLLVDTCRFTADFAFLWG